MKPTATLEDNIRELIAADATQLAPAALACHVHLIIGAFVPGRTTALASLTPATFTGSAAKSAGIGPQRAFRDTVLAVNVVQLLEPAGGWTWECTADPALEEIVYGYVVTDNANAVTYGSDLLPVPVPIRAAGDVVSLPNIRINLPIGTMF